MLWLVEKREVRWWGRKMTIRGLKGGVGGLTKGWGADCREVGG